MTVTRTILLEDTGRTGWAHCSDVLHFGDLPVVTLFETSDHSSFESRVFEFGVF